MDWLIDNIPVALGFLATGTVGAVLPIAATGFKIFKSIKTALKIGSVDLDPALKRMIDVALEWWWPKCRWAGAWMSKKLTKYIGKDKGNIAEDVIIYIVERSADEVKIGANSDD